MKLQTTRFGEIEIDENQILLFVKPILGFQNCQKFMLLPGPKDSPLWWLQSIEDGALAFLLLEPLQVLPDYQVSFTPQDLHELQADSPQEISIYTLLVVPEDPTKIRTNLRAPIVINTKTRLAKQMVLDRTDYPVQWFLAQPQNEQPTNRQEV
ncbi:MAG: flagellar assembly protein FliW [Candidatus Hydrogenedens sp.]